MVSSGHHLNLACDACGPCQAVRAAAAWNWSSGETWISAQIRQAAGDGDADEIRGLCHTQLFLDPAQGVRHRLVGHAEFLRDARQCVAGGKKPQYLKIALAER